MIGQAHIGVAGATALEAKLTELEQRVFPAALARALNRVANTIKDRTARDIADATGLKPRSVRRRIVFRQRATRDDPRAVLEITGKPFNLVEFVSGSKTQPRRPRGGVTANPWGRRRKWPGVFLARMPNGQVIAVQRSRVGRKPRGENPKMIARGRWAGKSPHIEAVWGAGIAREAAQPKLAAARASAMQERLPIELRHEIKFRVDKLLARRAKAAQ